MDLSLPTDKKHKSSEKMDVLHILEEATGDKKEAIRTYNALAELVMNDPDFRVMRANNTLFMYNNNKDKSADIAMETADSPRQLIESIKEFRKAMKIAGFKTGNFEIDNPQILKVLKMAGIEITTKPSGGMLDDGVTPHLIGTGEF